MDTSPLILVVDDEQEHGCLTGEKLKNTLNAEVRYALTAEECLECVGGESYDLLLLDFALPKMNGLELLNRFQEEGNNVPVVMMTGQGTQKIAVEAMKFGARDYLVKDDAFWTVLPLVVKRVLTEEKARQRLKELEAQQAEVAQLRKMNEIVVTLSHNINSPLAVILSNTDILLRKLQDASYREHLEKIMSSGRKISEIVFKLSHLVRPAVMPVKKGGEAGNVSGEEKDISNRG
ncbi:MAG: response regulator [Nitrospirota bacterium]